MKNAVKIYNIFFIILFNWIKIKGLINLINAQIFAGYTTNVYGRRSFDCYSCTNNVDTAHTRSKYQQASPDCGFSNDFKPSGSNVQRVPCYTYCMKKETGIVGSKIDVERRCEPTCQEYNGNAKIKYLIDKVSCCYGNLCNREIRLDSAKFFIVFLIFLALNLQK